MTEQAATTSSVVSVKLLLEAGAHFGHQVGRWNPKMKRYIFIERNGIHIINLEQTINLLDKASKYVTELVAGGGDTAGRPTPRSRFCANQSGSPLTGTGSRIHSINPRMVIIHTSGRASFSWRNALSTFCRPGRASCPACE